jgi:hypothetical protein
VDVCVCSGFELAAVPEKIEVNPVAALEVEARAYLVRVIRAISASCLVSELKAQTARVAVVKHLLALNQRDHLIADAEIFDRDRADVRRRTRLRLPGIGKDISDLMLRLIPLHIPPSEIVHQ